MRGLLIVLGFLGLVASGCATFPLGAAVQTGSSSYAEGSPRASTGWVNVHSGITFADTLTLGNAQVQLEGAGAPGMVLGVGAHWRTSRIDLGFLFESTSSFYFRLIEREFPIGGQFRAAANLRWRYIEDSWGALFMRLSPGLMAFRHADPVRNQVATLAGGNIDAVDQHSVGFSLGFDFGVILYVTERIALTVDLDIVSGTTTLDTDGGPTDYGLVRGLFTAGVEWRM